MVYVLNQNGSPLMPTNRYSHVRILLKHGRAKVINKYPFTIQLLYSTPDQVQPITLGIDPGRTNIGVTAVNDKGTPLFSANVETRNKDIPKLMQKRKMYRQKHRQLKRRAKRQRRAKKNQTVLKNNKLERHLPSFGENKTVTCNIIKNKQARFCNRRHPAKWLTPTANHLLQTHVNIIRKINKFLPVSHICIEVNKFAFMKLADPSVTGSDFQNGPLKGFDNNIKQAVHALQKGKCLLCGHDITQYHHVTAKSKNGSNTIKNIVGLCDSCHKLVHTNEQTKKVLLKKNQGLQKQYDALGILNQIIPFLLTELTQSYSLSITTGYATSQFRQRFNMTKDHNLDAYAIACSSLNISQAVLLDNIFHIKQFRRHDRQACEREMYNRRYILDGKTVALNRHRAFEQTEISLEEYVQQGGQTNNLTVKHIKKAMKDQNRLIPGCQITKKRIPKTLLKKSSGYYWFDDNTKTWHNKTQVDIHNAGLIFVSN